MDDFFDDELKQMEEREAAGDELITEAISLTDPIKSLSKGCLAIHENSSLREAVNQFQKENIGCAILTKDGKISGIFTERDILLNVLGKKLDFEKETVKDFMTNDPQVLLPTDPVSFALNKMVDGGFRNIPIVDGELNPVGQISILDVVNHLGQYFHQEILNLPPEPLRKQNRREGG
jgi:CBS domain-containing protein